MELVIIAITIIALAVFAILANELGTDSRELSDDPFGHPHTVGLA